MNLATQRQIYIQAGYQSNGIVSTLASSPLQADSQDTVRGQRPLKHQGQIAPIQERPFQKRISSRIAETIQSSRSILQLNDDWDEEGSKGYKEATWSRTVDWIKKSTLAFRDQLGFWVNPPRILPGPEGSIDIHWKTPKRELLINVPENMQEPADYYGCGDPKDTVKGKLDTSLSNEWILVWLTK